ncbi:MAG: twitch domain-containing radical SAM protein [Bdellovibrionales bacterium]|nr:twitch domain-containing radical SAM protein [Bdellovibrionales bacterium]NQZ19276.1 twitch domain-containing radical SAM protein [Bdellovibrionales bacterium]
MSEPKTLCSMLWNHAFVSPQGELKPCCRFKADKKYSSKNIQSEFSGQFWQDIRDKMKAGESVDGCKRCYQEEESGKLSLRQRYNKHKTLGLENVNLDEPQITWLEIPFSNRCNLACQMCDSRYSTKWLKDEKSLYGKTLGKDEVINYDWDQFLKISKNLRHVKVTGGEPLLDPKHDFFLDTLIANSEPQNIYLNYSTNLTIFPSSDVIEKWKKFQRIELALSLDSSIPEELNYIRYPTDGEQALNNVTKFMSLVNEMDNLHLILRSTVSAFNIFSMPRTLIWWNSKKNEIVSPDKLKNIKENPTHLTHPEHQAPYILKSSHKKKVEKEYSRLSKDIEDSTIQKNLDYLINIMNSSHNEESFDIFHKKTLAIDSIRNQDYRAIFPLFQ